MNTRLKRYFLILPGVLAVGFVSLFSFSGIGSGQNAPVAALREAPPVDARQTPASDSVSGTAVPGTPCASASGKMAFQPQTAGGGNGHEPGTLREKKSRFFDGLFTVVPDGRFTLSVLDKSLSGIRFGQNRDNPLGHPPVEIVNRRVLCAPLLYKFVS